MNEKYLPSGQLQGDTNPLPHRGTGTGFQSSGHAIFGQDDTQRFGGVRAGSDSAGQMHSKEDMIARGSRSWQDCTCSLGTFDARSAAHDEENVNDADAGD